MMSSEQESSAASTFHRPNIDFNETATKSTTGYKRLLERSKDNPLLPIGLTGTALMVAYGFYNYKNRGDVSTSLYMMKLRVKAQSVVVGLLTISVAYSMIDQFILKKKD
ncbi:HIGD1C (predicted) [Pycnogonum litorale]